MDSSDSKISFLELASRVIESIGSPMTAEEIWERAQQTGLVGSLRGTGKTPLHSLGAQLYTNVKKPNSRFVKVGARPSRFILKSMSERVPGAPPSSVTQQPKPSPFHERDLHQVLVWFADFNFNAHCRTVYHEKSLRRGERYNQWIHPDIVGFTLTTEDWTSEVVQLAQNSGAPAARLFSFEIKQSLDFTTLREYFFQAVSNSSWAHEGYLVAAEIDDDTDFREELSRLSQSFGIGIIHLDLKAPTDSSILFAAKEKSEIDWKTADRIAASNPDFAEFILSVAKSIRINQPAPSGFDKVCSDEEILAHVARLIGRDQSAHR